MRICRSLFESSYPKNKKLCLGFLFHLWNLNQILNIFQKKKIVIANVFPKLTTVQGKVMPPTIQCRHKTSFDSQQVKRFQTLVKSLLEHSYHIFSSLWAEAIWKISPLMKFEIIRLFVNTWTAHYKYPVPDCENLPFPFAVPYSSPVILETKNVCSVFYSIYGISIKFWTFSRKRRLSWLMYFRN